jgi:hypothetical protein
MLNHDFLAAHTEIRAADTPPIKVCNMGGGNTGIAAYRITVVRASRLRRRATQEEAVAQA